MRRLRMRGGWFVGHEFKQAIPGSKRGSPNKGGQAGNKRRKAHHNMRGLPGTPMGTHVTDTRRSGPCNCGGCSAKR